MSNHPTTCTGCPVCSPEMAAIMTMSAHEYALYLTKRTNEAFAANAATRPATLMRAAVARPEAGGGAVSPPPSLVERIRAAMQATWVVPASVPHPMPVPRTANVHGVNPPPSLTAAILAERGATPTTAAAGSGTNHNGVHNPPSLAERIRADRTKEQTR